METYNNIEINDHRVLNARPVYEPSSSFIEANTTKVSLEHLKKDCIIPVFSKDNESTISHSQFVESVYEMANDILSKSGISSPDIRVSHVVKGRTPSAIGKPAKELLVAEKTIYYERCAFIIDVPDITVVVNGNRLTLSIGGVRAYNQENLYSKKSLEKFKVFVGFKNRVCTNMCISTDGFSSEIRAGSVSELKIQIENLLCEYNKDKHIEAMECLQNQILTEDQFAHLIGRMRMYPQMHREEQKGVFPLLLNDGQITKVVKDYYSCPNFGRNGDGSIGLWKFYNLLTEANKSSYIDNYLERNVNAYELTNNLRISLKEGTHNWFLQH